MVDTIKQLHRSSRSGLAFSPVRTAALLATFLLAASPQSLHALTITEDYTYNVDGQLTATGTVTAGNGRLVGMGPQPGTTNLTNRFEFDARDRLTAYHGSGRDATYDYHANGMMSVSATDTDALRFYYDRSTNPRATNLYQASADLWSAYLEPVRYLSDGTEQALLTPRKDVACVYDAAQNTLQSYVYDAFGSSSPEAGGSGYDLRDNSFRYTGEHRDPHWGGYYLRARWYHPGLPSFISRDPAPNLNRYGYGGGNAYMNVDPSGLNFFSSMQAANKWLNKGIGGHFARIFLAPVVGAIQILANPKGFWEQIKTDKDGIDLFLAAGIVTEGLSIGLEGFGLSALVRNMSLAVGFGTRLSIDGGLAVGQAVAVGADRGFHHFNWTSFGQSAELSLGGLAQSRLSAGVGYNAFTLKAEDVLKRVQGLQDDRVLIFRERTEGNTLKTFTSPLMEAGKLGHYHERIIAVSKDFSVTTELIVRKHGGEIFGALKTRELTSKEAVARFFADKSRSGRYQFVGSVEDFSRESFKTSNPRGLLAGSEYQDRIIDNDWGKASRTARFSRWTNNCHYHAQAVLKTLEY